MALIIFCMIEVAPPPPPPFFPPKFCFVSRTERRQPKE